MEELLRIIGESCMTFFVIIAVAAIIVILFGDHVADG